jgi:hypothetical protein
MLAHRFSTFFRSVLVAVVATSCANSDDFKDDSIEPSPPAAEEPISGSAAVTVPGNESPPRDPFTPYSTGPGPTKNTPKPTWSYEDLTDAEKLVADKGRDTTGWDKVHDAYRRASAELAQRATREAAEHRLGIDGLATTGVVP